MQKIPIGQQHHVVNTVVEKSESEGLDLPIGFRDGLKDRMYKAKAKANNNNNNNRFTALCLGLPG